MEVDACGHKPGGARGPGYERWMTAKIVRPFYDDVTPPAWHVEFPDGTHGVLDADHIRDPAVAERMARHLDKLGQE